MLAHRLLRGSRAATACCACCGTSRCDGRARALGDGGDQQRLRVGAVLGLRQQIRGDEVGARAVIGDDHAPR